MEAKTLFKEVRYKFSKDELQEMAQEMAEAVTRLDNLEEELQEVRAGFKEKMARAQKTIKQTAAKIRSGWDCAPWSAAWKRNSPPILSGFTGRIPGN